MSRLDGQIQLQTSSMSWWSFASVTAEFMATEFQMFVYLSTMIRSK